MNLGDERAFHGGAFWGALDTTFSRPTDPVVAADVLDAWFSPPEELIQEFHRELPFLLRTAPPVDAGGLESVIGLQRGVPAESVVAGPGSSSLIAMILPLLLGAGDVLAVLEPTYSEYRFVATHLINAQCVSFELSPQDGFAFDAQEWIKWLEEVRPKVAVLVRPNNPTGTLVDVADVVEALPAGTTLIVDEAYIDYTDLRSCESVAANSERVIVIKSLSKAYGLLGLRLAYCVMHPSLARQFRRLTPPWFVSALAQWFGCRLWNYLDYYSAAHRETEAMRAAFEREISAFPGRVLASRANWILWEHDLGLSTAELMLRLQSERVFVRDASRTSPSLSDRTLRIAVRPEGEREMLLGALGRIMGRVDGGRVVGAGVDC